MSVLLNKDLNPCSYTWGLPKFVAYLDILGFRAAMNHINPPVDSYSTKINSGDLTYGLWRNVLLPIRERLSHSPCLNFVQMSDAAVFYADSSESLLDLVSDVFGRALVWGVPIRGGLGFGIINHSEEFQRPGTLITLYGDGLVDAYQSEQSGKSQGMRLFVSRLFREQVEAGDFRQRGAFYEFPWWLRCGVDVDHFEDRRNTWWGDSKQGKTVGRWFTGPHRKDTEQVFNLAIEELSAGGQ